jgi:hypothetical protein
MRGCYRREPARAPLSDENVQTGRRVGKKEINWGKRAKFSVRRVTYSPGAGLGLHSAKSAPEVPAFASTQHPQIPSRRNDVQVSWYLRMHRQKDPMRFDSQMLSSSRRLSVMQDGTSAKRRAEQGLRPM